MRSPFFRENKHTTFRKRHSSQAFRRSCSLWRKVHQMTLPQTFLARIYTKVLHFYFQPSAASFIPLIYKYFPPSAYLQFAFSLYLLHIPPLVGHACPTSGHTCPPRLVNAWWLKAEGRSTKPPCIGEVLSPASDGVGT